VSCATLETVMNLAALNSTYQGHEHIYKDDVTDALLQVVYKLSKTDKSLDLTECQKIALHEAAHAVVGEILNPDSIGIVTIRGNQSCIGGFENGCSTYLKNEEELLNDITKTLAGKAGVSLIYGVMDVNASGDIQNANRLLDLWMTSLAGAGFSEVESANNRMSETRLFSSEAIKAAKMEELYRRAYKILYDNRDFLLAVQKELLEHETLLNSDLAKIRESCT
jgi:cell division protease FtsH